MSTIIRESNGESRKPAFFSGKVRLSRTGVLSGVLTLYFLAGAERGEFRIFRNIGFGKFDFDILLRMGIRSARGLRRRLIFLSFERGLRNLVRNFRGN